MKKQALFLVMAALLCLSPDLFSQRFQGHGGAGPRPGGGGVPRTPSFSGVPQNRPAFGQGNRPGGGAGLVPGQRPNIGNGNRPNFPGGNGAGRPPTTLPANRPNFPGGNRPDRPTTLPAYPNRPNVGINNRPINVNRPNSGNINVNRPNSGNINVNRPVNINQQKNLNVLNRQNNFANVNRHHWNGYRPGTRYPYYRPGHHYPYYPRYGYYKGWYHGRWSNWNRYPPVWAGTAAGTGWLLAPSTTTYAYSNPFYVPPATVVNIPNVDYSQPLVMPEVSVPQSAYAADNAEPNEEAASSPDEAPEPDEVSAPPEATERFEAARKAFQAGNYDTALREVDKAIALVPGDPALHEFRGLVQFAQKKYKEAAATIYAVLAAGPGWDWDTLRSFYSDPEVYNKQLRALETFVKANPDASDGHFLLAYHYLVLGHIPNALNQLKQFEKLVPSDKLVPQLIQAFSAPPDTEVPTPQDQ